MYESGAITEEEYKKAKKKPRVNSIITARKTNFNDTKTAFINLSSKLKKFEPVK